MLDRAQQGSARRARKVTAALSSQPAEKVARGPGAKWHGGRLSQLRVPTLVLHGATMPF